uniref:Nuclear pore complex protein Nup50 n=1 Tax=Lepisosteus oculatus TaxID=7918 RepID=W5NIG0_LEPOC|nr:PREDICTED: nuclear pore complex protein Nup50 [Lepisosteus oculatus]
MAKRVADKELNDRNWDQEDEGEEAGTFSVASQDVLKNRAIKKAKRRNAAAEGESGGNFKGFKGFTLSASGSAGGFAGFGNGSGLKPLSSLTNGNGSSSSTPSFSGFSSTSDSKATTESLTFNGPASSQPQSNDVSRQSNGVTQSSSAPSSQSSSRCSREYNRQLTALNCSVRDWIAKHVNDNPLCDLNPIFKDYERHLATIEEKYGGSSDSGSESEPGSRQAEAQPGSVPGSSGAPQQKATAALFSFSKEEKESSSAPAPSAPAPNVTFNFGQKVDSSALGPLPASSTASFSFSSQGTGSLFGSQGTTPASTFSFTSAKTSAPSEEKTKDENAGDEESEEPPKPVVNEVKEDDAFFSKKCKLFYKKENEFKEKGVGTLHLKLVADKKTQLLVRADTNLGNILLNILLQSSMPCTRMGKNNVMVVCVPNPPVDEKNPTAPVPILIRVKTAEDADELHKLLLEKKA